MMNIFGIHHVTALSGDPQKNIDFYAGVLGLRLLKKTVNFDDPETYHFYYGDETGSPGTILTFFPYSGIHRGRPGNGMVNTISFSVSAGSLGYWKERLAKFDIVYGETDETFGGEPVIAFEDTDGLSLELVFSARDGRPGFTYGHIPLEHSVKGFYSVTIHEEGYERTAGLLTAELEHVLLAESGNRFRFCVEDSPGKYIDLVCLPDAPPGRSGGGTVHHIAFGTPDLRTQAVLRDALSRRMLNPTPVIDRQYFKSVYFREPGGVLFEAATAGPGFTVDEPLPELGTGLKLPSRYERWRESIERAVVPVELNIGRFR